ncbi:hypothetical protein NLX74_10835 [Paenibacillus sp. MZ03-122A]|nr:hypothetical protein [Paenibacillus sp. MZ03-122A]
MGNTPTTANADERGGRDYQKDSQAVAVCGTVVHANRIKLLSAKPGNILLIPKVAPKE